MSTPTNPSQPGGDPSMEDILASIRRILSEDEPPPPEPAGKDQDTGVLVLDPSMMVEEPTDNAPVENAMNQEAQTDEPAHAPEPVQAAAAQTSARGDITRVEHNGGGLVAPEAAAAAASSVGHLVRALTERSAQIHQGGPTIEDVVRDAIRPILKQWLDANLPPLVERLVRIEIERVVGRAVP